MAVSENTSTFSIDGNADGLLTMMQRATKAVEDGTGQITGAFGKVGSSITGVVGIVGTLTGVIAGGAAFGAVVSETNSWNLEAMKLSKTLGITTEQASILNLALGDVYLSQEDMLAGTSRITKTLKDNEKAFHDLGVATRDQDGHYRNTLEVMTEVNTKLGQFKEGTDRNVALMAIYGRGWQEVSGLLKLNKEVMAEAQEKAERLHLIVGPEGIEKTKQYRAALNDLEDVGKSFAVQVGSELIPALTQLGVSFSDAGTLAMPMFAQAIKAATRDAAEFGVVVGVDIDKINAWLDTGGLLGHMFSKEKAAEYARQIAIINQAATEQFAEIENRYAAPDKVSSPKGGGSLTGIPGAGTPAKGNTGDGLTPGKLLAWMDGYWAQVDEREFQTALADSAGLGFSLAQGRSTNLSWQPKEKFDSMFDLMGGADSAGWKQVDPYAQFAEERLRLEERYKGGVSQIQAELQQSRLAAIGEEEQALETHYTFKEQKLFEDYQRQVNYANQIGMDTTLIKQQYDLQLIQLEEEKAQRLADIWWNNSQTYINFAQQMTTMGIQMLLSDESQRSQIGSRMLATSIRFVAQGLQAYMFGKAKEHLLNAAAMAGAIKTKTTQAAVEMGIGGQQAAAWAAYFSAMSMNPYGGQAFIPAATAMTAATAMFTGAAGTITATGAAGIAAELAMAALWGAGGIAVGGLGEAGASAIEGGTSGGKGAAGYGVGTPGSPVITQPVGKQQPTQVTVIVNMNGAMYADKDKMDRWIEEEFAPSFRDAIGRNVDFSVVTE